MHFDVGNAAATCCFAPFRDMRIDTIMMRIISLGWFKALASRLGSDKLYIEGNVCISRSYRAGVARHNFMFLT